MLEHFKGDEIFVKKILDYRYQALEHQRMILTPFLNPHEQEVVRQVIGSALQVVSDGGFDNAESQRMIICPSFYEIQPDDFQITVVKVKYPKQFGHLKHSDVLGALMHLGIKRDCIGDIVEGDEIHFACTNQTYPFILNNLTNIKKFKVNLKQSDERIEIKHQYSTKTFFLSSFRLDKVVATLYRVPREEASRAIKSGYVKVNHKEVEEVSFLCHNNDMISFSRHGRVKIVDEGRKSRQGYSMIIGYFYK